jgi:hypothetical protein
MFSEGREEESELAENVVRDGSPRTPLKVFVLDEASADGFELLTG